MGWKTCQNAGIQKREGFLKVRDSQGKTSHRPHLRNTGYTTEWSNYCKYDEKQLLINKIY